jgi:hypothetical protein
LTQRRYPSASAALVRYADRVDDGSIGLTLKQPFSLYAAYRQVTGRLASQPFAAEHERWRECLRQGLLLADFTAAKVEAGASVLEVDAFACPGLFTEADRQEIRKDRDRYLAKLREPRTRARRTELFLPGVLGGTIKVWSLRVRDVQNPDDPERVLFFKDWARSDAERCPNKVGYAALCVFMSEGPNRPRRCILSVTPDCGATLSGLGERLDAAEAERRRQLHGVDDRVTDPATGQLKAFRQGYGNSDPWYDGRGHGYTIVDGPRDGTVLTSKEIEDIFLSFGGVTPT